MEDRANQALLLGLFAVTLPAVVYSLAQLCSLVGGGHLTQAIRAFAP